MELYEIHAIIRDLVRIRGSKLGPLELQHRDDPGSQQDAIDAKAPTPKVILEDNVRVGGQALSDLDVLAIVENDPDSTDSEPGSNSLQWWRRRESTS